MHRHTARAQRVQIAPYASFVATTLATIDAVLVVAWARPDLPLLTMLTMQLGHPSTSAPAQASAAR